MEKYASEAAVAAGLPPSSFEFAQAVGEAIPLDDASVDAVIGTLVLCSVEDVDLTLQEVKRVLKPGGVYIFVEHVAAKDGTAQRLLQNVFDPLQQTLADGCHLARQTGNRISKAGFSFLYIDSAHLSSALFINPHVYGMATKPHGSTSTDDPNEPYWQTNLSFSPPPNSGWGFGFSPEELPCDSSSHSVKETGWMRGNPFYSHQSLTSDCGEGFLSSPEMSRALVLRGIRFDELEAAMTRGIWIRTSIWSDLEKCWSLWFSCLSLWWSSCAKSLHTNHGGSVPHHVFPSSANISLLDFGLPRSLTVQGIPGNNGKVSSSSNSDFTDLEAPFKSCLSSHCNFASHRSFLLKPVHPLSFPFTSQGEASETTRPVYQDYYDSSSQRDAYSRSSASSSSSTDFADVSETLEPESLGCPSASSNGFKCRLCERFLSHRSPYSSRRIMMTGTMHAVAVLSCRHVFHTDCLDQITPKSHSSDPPCPICSRFEEGNSPEQIIFTRLRNSFPQFSRPLLEDTQSRPRACLQGPQCNSMLVLNRNRLRKNLALKANSIKEFPGKVRRNGLSSLQVSSSCSNNGDAVVGCSKAAAGIQV
ncbi:Putative methyltransferase-like protein 7A [Linum perenne]